MTCRYMKYVITLERQSLWTNKKSHFNINRFVSVKLLEVMVQPETVLKSSDTSKYY